VEWLAVWLPIGHGLWSGLLSGRIDLLRRRLLRWDLLRRGTLLC
jgi:hypothetical protein